MLVDGRGSGCSHLDRLFTFTFLIPSMLVLMNDTALNPKHAAELAHGRGWTGCD